MAAIDGWLKPQLVTSEPNKSLIGIMAGGLTDAVELLFTYPTEYVKTQLQLDEKGVKKKYYSALDCATKTIRDRGVLSIYRGLSVFLLGTIPKSAIRFSSFEFMSQRLENANGSMPSSHLLIAGLFAGMTEAIVAVTPMETIKVKFIHDMRSPNPKYKGLVNGVGQIIKDEGIGGIYKGLPATMIRQGSNMATRFFFMFIMKDMYTGRDRNKSVPKYIVGSFGAIAGFTSVISNNPIDVVKTRMQGLEASRYKNTLDCARQILANEGFSAFYKGTIPRLCRVSLNVAITFVLYDTLMDFFKTISH